MVKRENPVPKHICLLKPTELPVVPLLLLEESLTSQFVRPDEAGWGAGGCTRGLLPSRQLGAEHLWD